MNVILKMRIVFPRTDYIFMKSGVSINNNQSDLMVVLLTRM